MNRLTRITLSLTFAASLAGCKVGPNYKRPVVATPAGYRGALAPDVANTSGGTPLGAQKWDSVFTDPVLQGLVNEALKNNFDVKIAADRVLEEQAQVGIVRSAEYPSVNFGAALEPSGQATGGATGSSGTNTSHGSYLGILGLSASWNLDFWGYYRRQTEAARAELSATQWAQQTTYSTLVQSVATAYYQLRTLDAEMAITKQTLVTRRQSLDLTNTLNNGGTGTLADVRQAEELYYTAQAQVPTLEQQIQQQENALSLLLGRSPSSIARDVDASGNEIANAPHPVAVPVGLPSELLERRPDVRRAEELLIQANANIGVARAAFFPQFPLSGAVGVGSNQLKGLVDSKNLYYYGIGEATQAIFEGGRLRGNLHLAEAQHKELTDTYQQTIAGALRDVSNALIAYTKTREYREQQEKLVFASGDAVRLARMRYQSGYTSYLEVLTNDATLYSSQLTLATAQQQEALSLVQLYNALGGGW
jgi:multidrug efflux system outer membrane protein